MADEQGELKVNAEYDARWKRRLEGFEKRQEHKRKQQSEAMEDYNKSLEKRARKIREGKERDVHYFNDLAAESLEKKKNRSDGGLKDIYHEVFAGKASGYDLEYQITAGDKPIYVIDGDRPIKVDARMFAVNGNDENSTGFLFIMDTDGKWYMQTIKKSVSEAVPGQNKWKADQKPMEMKDPSQVADLLDQSKKNKVSK